MILNSYSKFAFTAGAVITAAGMLSAPASAAGKVSGDPGFGRQFVRNNPFTLTAGNSDIIGRSGPGVNARDLGLNAALLWRFRQEEGVQHAAQNGLNWFVMDHTKDLSVQRVNQLTQTPGGLGIQVSDEPSRQNATRNMPDFGAKLQELRTANPNLLYFSNAYPSYATTTQLWGDTSNPDYTYEQYLDDFISIIKPDVMMYDHYPYTDFERRRTSYFPNLMAVRDASQDAGIPYWAWLQTFEQYGWRSPSESDMRMQAFSHLAAGYKGFSYWFWTSNENVARNGLMRLNDSGEPVATQNYFRAQNMSPEIVNLGQALRFLESTAVRFVPGQGGTAHTTPAGLSNFTQGAGGDPHILSINVEGDGTAKDGLIGFFTDDNGQHYFMLTNIYHSGDLTPAQAALDFEIAFDDEVEKLLRLNRLTGEQEVIDLTGNTLMLTLPGGTGDLFKYDTGDFVVPEPTTLGLLALGGAAMLGRRRRT